ncbi:MAG: LysR family transcriptional regulator [Henriciella sp.]|nr:LysR family transcriptional regulator [Henriciella sp.]
MANKSDSLPTLSLRLDLPGGGRFGPGKAALMRAIASEGSVAAAARKLGMSYPRALRLIDDMNTQFEAPLVDRFHGGATRGGASLTELGQQVLQLYDAVCADALSATDEARQALFAVLNDGEDAKKD